jgi:hypothetical protein
MVYIANPYTQVGIPHKLEHPPIGQAFLITSQKERYPENSIPAIAIINIIFNAVSFFIVRKK